MLTRTQSLKGEVVCHQVSIYQPGPGPNSQQTIGLYLTKAHSLPINEGKGSQILLIAFQFMKKEIEEINNNTF